MHARHIRPTVLLVLGLASCGRGETTPRAEPPALDPTVGPLASLVPTEGWNSAQIAWQPYDAGLAMAKAQNKPVCLIFFTGWCPHCKNYSRVFEDPQVVERSRDFVMIRLDGDQNRDVSAKYQPDGGYVPRTFFLAPDGTLLADVHAPRPKFLYFYDEHRAASLLEGMAEALRKLRGR